MTLSAMALSAVLSCAPPLPPMWSGPILPGVHELELQTFVEECDEWLAQDSARDPALDEDMQFLIRALTPALVGLPRYGGSKAYTRMAPLLEIEGVKHPLVQLAHGLTLPKISTASPSAAPYQKACTELTARHAPARLRYAANMLAGRQFTKQKSIANAEPYFNDAGKALAEMIAQYATAVEGRTPSKTQLRMVCRWIDDFIDTVPPAVSSQLLEALGTTQGLDKCLLETCLGLYDIHIAWKERGSGYASTVKDDAWTKFNDRLGKASQHLRAAWELDSSRPEAAAALITVSMAGNDDEDEVTWFNRAVKADPACYDAYSRLRTAALPRWGGSLDKVLAVGKTALASKTFNTDVPAMYLSVLEDLCEDTVNANWMAHTGIAADLDTLSRGFTGAGNHSWDSEIASWMLVNAYKSGDLEAAVVVLQNPNVTLDMDALKSARLNIRDVKFDCWSLTGPTAADVQAADALMKKGNFEGAVDGYTKALQKCTDQQAPHQRKDAISDKLAIAASAAGLATNEATPIAVDSRLHGWRIDNGFFHSPVDGQAIGGGSSPKLARMRLAHPVGRRFEASADMWVWQRGGRWSDAGFHFGIGADTQEQGWYCVSWVPEEKVVDLWATYQKEFVKIPVEVKEPDLGKPMKARLSIEAWDNWVAISLNGQQIYAGMLPQSMYPVGNGFGFGTVLVPRREAKSGFSDLKIRTLRSMPDSIRNAQAKDGT